MHASDMEHVAAHLQRLSQAVRKADRRGLIYSGSVAKLAASLKEFNPWLAGAAGSGDILFWLRSQRSRRQANRPGEQQQRKMEYMTQKYPCGYGANGGSGTHGT